MGQMHSGRVRSPTSPILADLAWAGLATLVVTALLLSSGGVGGTIGGGDLFGYFVPKYEAVTRALFVEHRLPLWNPYEFTGVPLLGSHQANTFYGPTWLAFGLLPTHAALQAFTALHVFVLAFGMITYLRRYGVPRPVGVLGVLVATAGVFTGHGHTGVDHPGFLGSMAWFPLILLLWEKSVEALRPWLGWMAIAVAGQWLAGYPDFALSSPLLLGVLALTGVAAPISALRSPPEKSTVTRRIGVLVAGLALGGSLAGIQLLPTAEVVAQSARGLSGVDHSALRRLVLLETWPSLSQWTIERVGTATFLLALIPLLRPTRAHLAWAAALAFTLLVGWPPLRWLYHLPVFSSIRLPFAWDLLGTVLWGILACVGVAVGLRSPSRWIRGFVAVVALWAAGFSAYVIQHEPAHLRYPRPDAEHYRVRAGILADLVRRTSIPDIRIVSPRDASAGTPIRHRMMFAAGHEPAVPPARIADLFGQFYPSGRGAASRLPVFRNPQLASLLGVGLAVLPARASRMMRDAGFRKIGPLPSEEEAEEVWYQPPIPRARIVHQFVVASGDEEALARTVDPSRDMRRTAVIETQLPSWLPSIHPQTSDEREHARITTSEPERVVIEAHLERPGLLVLTDTFFASWTATVDGESTDVLPTDYAFRGIPLRAGEHQVVFECRGLAVWAGAFLTFVSATIVLSLIRPRRRNESARRR